MERQRKLTNGVKIGKTKQDVRPKGYRYSSFITDIEMSDFSDTINRLPRNLDISRTVNLWAAFPYIRDLCVITKYSKLFSLLEISFARINIII